MQSSLLTPASHLDQPRRRSSGLRPVIGLQGCDPFLQGSWVSDNMHSSVYHSAVQLSGRTCARKTWSEGQRQLAWHGHHKLPVPVLGLSLLAQPQEWRLGHNSGFLQAWGILCMSPDKKAPWNATYPAACKPALLEPTSAAKSWRSHSSLSALGWLRWPRLSHFTPSTLSLPPNQDEWGGRWMLLWLLTSHQAPRHSWLTHPLDEIKGCNVLGEFSELSRSIGHIPQRSSTTWWPWNKAAWGWISTPFPVWIRRSYSISPILLLYGGVNNRTYLTELL